MGECVNERCSEHLRQRFPKTAVPKRDPRPKVEVSPEGNYIRGPEERIWRPR